MREQWTDQIRRQYLVCDEELQRSLVRHAEAGGRTWCAKGCSRCCTLAVNCTFGEALVVAEALTPQQSSSLHTHAGRVLATAQSSPDFKTWLRRHRQEIGPCPFLAADGSCGVYAQRPFSCRALFSTRNSDWCEVDFAALAPLERQVFMSSLDPRIVAFPTHYLAAPQETGRRLEEEAAGQMARRLGFSLRGHLAFLVWLIREHRLAQTVGAGPAATEAWLARNGFDHPFLVDLETTG